MEITNNTNSDIKQLSIYIKNDTLPDKIYENIKVGKTLKFSQFNFVSQDPNKNTSWGIEFEDSGKIVSRYCTDVDGSNHNREAKINITEEAIEVVYNGSCY